MRRAEFIDIILNSISNNFDIYHNYNFDGKTFEIYAYCYNHTHKPEQSDELKLWESNAYEHLFFISIDSLSVQELTELTDFAIHKIEPHFVRGDGKHPVKHHLCSYLSFIIITKTKPLPEIQKLIEETSWSRNYLLSARGYTELRLACITPREYSVIANKSATNISDFLMDILLHIDHYEEEDTDSSPLLEPTDESP